MKKGQIVRVDPAAAIPGGEVAVECEGYGTRNPRACQVLFDDILSRPVGLAPWRVLATVPEAHEGGEAEVVLVSAEGERTEAARVRVGRKLAEDLHIVANPAFDPDDGSLYVTRSGSRGQRMPVSLFRIDTDGEITSIHGEIANPTGIAFDSLGQMFVTSRMDSTVYRVTPFHEVIPFARNLGVATGIAFDPAGRMYVGDREGTIHRVNGEGEADVWAMLKEPSVAAYHLAFGPEGDLYVTGPTVSSYQSVWRVDPDGRASVFFRGLGRPQGLAFDREGNLYVAASYGARRGVVRITPDGDAELVVAGMNVVGLAFSAAGEMVVATNDSVYTLPLGIRGTLLKQ